jgi:hypothetical protein
MRTPLLIAASMMASAITAGLAVKSVYDMLSGITQGVGGIGALSAGLADAFLGIFVGGCIAAAILVYALIDAGRASARRENGRTEVRPTLRSNAIAIVIAFAAIVVGHFPQHEFANAALATFNAVRPDRPSSIRAETLRDMLFFTGIWSLSGALATLFLIAIAFLMRRTMRPSRVVAIVITLLALVPVANGLRWSWHLHATLKRVAISGDARLFSP